MAAGRVWIHVALAAVSRFVLEIRVGPRTLALARELLVAVAEHCRPGAPLLLEADEHRPYPQAILDIFGRTRFRRRRQAGRGKRKLPDSVHPPGLMVGLVHKVRDRCRRLLAVKPKRLAGRLRDIRHCLRRFRLGCQINTSHVERLNGTLRTQQTRLARRTRNRSMNVEQMQAALWLWRDLYHWTRPHASLKGRTPAIAMGLTQDIWSARDYVLATVHVSNCQRLLWKDQHDQLLTAGLYNQKHRLPQPTN